LLRGFGSLFRGNGPDAQGDFGEFLAQALQARNQAFQEMLEGRTGPTWWRDSMREYVDRVRVAQAKADYWVPLDILGEMPLERARTHTQQLIGDFGRLLLGWAELVSATQELLAQRPLAACL